MVHPGGRPRTVSFSEEEMIALGEEMINWVKENKPIHLSMWYTQVKDFTDKEWDSFRKRPEFVHYYTKALKLVGYSYLDKDSNVDVRLKDRWQRVYFKDLREQEDEDQKNKLQNDLENKQKLAEHQAKLDSDVTNKIDENILNHFKATMDQLSSLQSERKIAESNINNEAKS